MVDLGGDVIDNPKLSGTKHNVFGIKTGVAMVFLVKKKGRKGGAIIRYARRPEFETGEEKLSFLSSTGGLRDLTTPATQPDKQHNWLSQTDNDWDTLLPSVDPRTTPSRTTAMHPAIFRFSTNGLQTKRDEWVYSQSKTELESKIDHLTVEYGKALASGDRALGAIKWDRELNRRLEKREKITVAREHFRQALFRPFTAKEVYFNRSLNSQSFRLYETFPHEEANPTLTFLCVSSANPLATLATDQLFDTSLLKNGNGSTQSLPRFRYPKGERGRLDNITDWALKQFTKRYGKAAVITKDDIFAYVYAVLHDPAYRDTYALNLKREFPRIPLYADFKTWRDWGQRLLDLHIGYEAAKPFALTRTDTPDPRRAEGTTPAVKLKSDPDDGIVVLDTETTLSGIPPEAWRYRLGNRSAIDWVLDQHKERSPRDSTIREKFNTYRFADYKEKVVDLLAKVVTVSLETIAITDAMAALPASSRASPASVDQA